MVSINVLLHTETQQHCSPAAHTLMFQPSTPVSCVRPSSGKTRRTS
jgi:hypothetical protein